MFISVSLNPSPKAIILCPKSTLRLNLHLILYLSVPALVFSNSHSNSPLALLSFKSLTFTPLCFTQADSPSSLSESLHLVLHFTESEKTERRYALAFMCVLLQNAQGGEKES